MTRHQDSITHGHETETRTPPTNESGMTWYIGFPSAQRSPLMLGVDNSHSTAPRHL